MSSLIFGITGQDGQLLSSHLLKKGINVIGTTRTASVARALLHKSVVVEEVNPLSIDEVISVIKKYKPSQIYNLAAQSSVGLSFERPGFTINSNIISSLNILEAIRILNLNSVRVFNASSSECFGDVGETTSSELTPFNPQSPYGLSKTVAHNLFVTYRDLYGIHASNGILYNHESLLRPDLYVTKKIVRSAYLASIGKINSFNLGRIDIKRDWGWAEEYVEAMALMLDQSNPSDYIISTGNSVTLEYFLERAFLEFDLNYKDFTFLDNDHFRPNDIITSRGSPFKAKRLLGWQAKSNTDDVIKMLCQGARDQ